MGLSAHDHVRPALQELHWLPVVHCIKFKVALLMFMAHNYLCPLYISEVVVSQFIGSYILLVTAISLYQGREPSSATEHFWSLDRRFGTQSLSPSGQLTTFFVSNVNSRHAFLTFLTDFIVPHRHHTVTVLTVPTVFDTVLPGWSGSYMLGTKHILLVLVLVLPDCAEI